MITKAWVTYVYIEAETGKDKANSLSVPST